MGVKSTEYLVKYSPKYLLLLLDDNRELCVRDAGVEFAAHQRCSLVVLDVAHILGLGNLNVLRETLLMIERISRIGPILTEAAGFMLRKKKLF